MTPHSNPEEYVMTSKQPDATARRRVIDAARAAARSTVERFALDQGAQVVARPAFPGSDRTVRDVEPLAGLRAAYEVELSTRHVGRDYIRYAREAGRTWHDIGVAMNLTPGRDIAGESIGEAAFTYAAGNQDTETARQYGRSVTWTCKSCDQLISDRGLCSGPADDGHADDCAARRDHRQVGRRMGSRAMTGAQEPSAPETEPVDHLQVAMGKHPRGRDHAGLTARTVKGPPELYTAEEAAAILRVRTSWLERQAASRKIPFTLLGGRYRFSGTHLAEIVLMYEQPVAPRPQSPARPARTRRGRTPKSRDSGELAPLRPRPRDGSRGVA